MRYGFKMCLRGFMREQCKRFSKVCSCGSIERDGKKCSKWLQNHRHWLMEFVPTSWNIEWCNQLAIGISRDSQLVDSEMCKCELLEPKVCKRKLCAALSITEIRRNRSAKLCNDTPSFFESLADYILGCVKSFWLSDGMPGITYHLGHSVQEWNWASAYCTVVNHRLIIASDLRNLSSRSIACKIGQVPTALLWIAGR